MVNKFGLLVLFCAVLFVVCGCVSVGDIEYTRTQTVGQELIDLQKAKDAGIVTEEEFCKKKKAILDEEIRFSASCSSNCSKCPKESCGSKCK